jgi:hypothetical protein
MEGLSKVKYSYSDPVNILHGSAMCGVELHIHTTIVFNAQLINSPTIQPFI